MFDFDFDLPSDMSWRHARIEKKGKPGQYRILTIPNDELKNTQRNILRMLYSVRALAPSKIAHGFVRRRNTSTGVLSHNRMAPTVLGMDIKDFFDNFPLEVVYNRLVTAGIREQIADKIMRACTYKGSIPQGAPTSPALTNIGMFETDCKLMALAEKNGYTVTRYADDITFSELANPEVGEDYDEHRRKYTRYIFEAVNAMLVGSLGLHLNKQKSHVIHLHGREKRQVTGIVIRKDGLGYNAPKNERRKVRAMLYNLAKKIESQGGHMNSDDRAAWAVIVGKVRYFDNLRAYSDVEVSGADTCVQAKYWKYVEEASKRK